MLSGIFKVRQGGVTLVELLIAITVMAILLGIALPSFQTWIQNSQIRTAAESIQSGLQRARAEAVARNTKVEFVIGADTSWVVKLAGGANIESRSGSEGSKNVTRTVLPAGATTVTFDSFGFLTANADGSARLAQVDVDSTVLPADVSRNLRVTIGAGGNARMCDPNLSAGTTAC